MYCPKCGALQEVDVFRKVSFRSECDKCGTSLHSCVNCKFYQLGLPNDCRVPGTERIVDRQASNFCEEFAATDKPPQARPNDDKKRFEDLFK